MIALFVDNFDGFGEIRDLSGERIYTKPRLPDDGERAISDLLSSEYATYVTQVFRENGQPTFCLECTDEGFYISLRVLITYQHAPAELMLRTPVLSTSRPKHNDIYQCRVNSFQYVNE